jgi:3-phenylpropionate/trans-cinnamate dioxygenase ferredoxin reductase subunit
MGGPPGTSIVIVGASHAGAQLADSLRREHWDGGIVMIGDEPELPYHRPPLSKEYLAGKLDDDRLPIRDQSFYTERGIHMLLGRRVIAIDRGTREVAVDDGSRIAFAGLAMVTGARPRLLSVAGERLDGVFVLRSVADVRAIRAHLPGVERAVVIGGGFIGLECAASLRGLGKQVTVLEARERLMPRVMPVALSEFYLQLHADHGVRIACNAAVREITGDGTRVTGVTCVDGSIYPAEMVIVGVGVIPNDELARACGLECNNGIVVDEHARTSDAMIVAAGDCANHPNRYFGGHVRLESVQNATDQARTAAATLVGHDATHDAVPWFWSDQYDIKLQMVGTSQGQDRAAIRGDRAARRFSTFYFRDGRFIGTDSINDPASHLISRKIIGAGWSLTPEQAADSGFDLRSLGAAQT